MSLLNTTPGSLEEGLPNVQHQRNGEVRTSMNCHACKGTFMALIDHSVDANLVIVCPGCGHKHYRAVRNGIVTDERHGSDSSDAFRQKVTTWGHATAPARTMSTSEYLAERWRNLVQSPKGR